MDLELIKRFGLKNEDYADILRGINGDWPWVKTAEVMRVRSNADSLSIVDGMLNSRIYVRVKMREDMLMTLHSGHQGIV